MKPFKNILLISFFSALTASFAGTAIAEDKGTPSDTPNATASSAVPAEAFVDRDGDGIADGREHRFRKRSGRRSGADKKQMKQKRNQNKGGAGNGARIR